LGLLRHARTMTARLKFAKWQLWVVC
jgi:hypothetical protein